MTRCVSRSKLSFGLCGSEVGRVDNCFVWSVACGEYPAVRSRLEALLSFVAAQHSADGVSLLLGVV